MANSFVRYTGNGSTTQYAISFTYRDQADITVTINGVATTAFTYNSAGTQITFSSPPANLSAIEIRRRTSQTSRLVDYAAGSVLTENDLDTDSNQAFFMGQEAIDDAGDVIKIDSANFQWDVQNKRLTNVADPVDNTDGVNKQFISTNLPNITTVAGIASDVTTVANNNANVTAVANDATDIGTVATNIASVNTVATNINDVIKVADDLNEAISEVETVANDLNEATSEIEVVANNITNVNTVGTNIANVNTVAGIDANVTTVAGISSDVTSVAGISTAVSNVNSNSTNINAVNANSANINTVAGINTNVTSVAGISSAVTAVNNNSSNINAVNSNSANINTVAGNSTNINTVAGNNSNISTVAGVSSNVTTVAGISSDVTAVAGDATDIGTVATNLTGTNTIGTVAGSIANVNNVGGSIANVNTVAGNLSGVNYFGERYRVSSSAPSTSLDVGDLYYDTTTDAMKVYGSSGWQNAGSSVNGTSQRYNYTATSGQTTFTGADNNGNTLTYDAGYIDVYLNGVKLLNGTDVTVTSGSSVVLASGATTGDVVDIVAYGTFSVASLNADNLTSGTVPDARITGAYTGITNLTMSGDLTVDTNTLKVDSTNNRVGIGTVNPNFPLQLDSNRADATFDANDVSTWSDFKIQGQTAVGNARGIYFDFDQDTGNDRGSGIVGISQDGTGGVGELGFITTSGNNSQERVRIDRNGQISIAGNTPSFDTTGAKNGLQLYYETDTGLATIGSYSSGGTTSLTFHTNASGNASTEKMRIDSSGNLLVGKTFSNISTVGVEFRPEGLGIFGRDGNTALTVNRKTSDGKIISVRKDNTEIGSIGVHNTRITIGNQDTGLKFNSGIDSIFPFDLSIEANRDNAVDLGWGSARFRDLYLGGGLYVGGTGTANKLDDYEEGTFTPSIIGGSTAGTATYIVREGRYTKVGNTVYITVCTQYNSGTGSGSLRINGLPFNSKSASQEYHSLAIGYFDTISLTSNYIPVALVNHNNSNEIHFNQFPAGGGSSSAVSYDGTGFIIVSGTYVTD